MIKVKRGVSELRIPVNELLSLVCAKANNKAGKPDPMSPTIK